MRLIKKHSECPELVAWKKRHPEKKLYDDLDSTTRSAMREAMRKEQYGLCAFCCNRLRTGEGRNAHLKSRQQFPQLGLCWDNLAVSCERKESCDQHQGGRSLTLTPLMPECETEIIYYVTGEVEGTTARAQEAIDILGLNERKVRESRKAGINKLAMNNLCDPIEDIACLSDDEKTALIEMLDEVDEDGNLPAYQPVLKSIIRMMLSYPTVT